MEPNYLGLEYISTKEAAELAGVDYVTILAAIEAGELTAVQRGMSRGRRTTKKWLNSWVASKVINPEAAKQGEK